MDVAAPAGAMVTGTLCKTMSVGRVQVAVGIYAAFAGVAMVWRELQGASAWHDGAPLGTTHAIAIPAALSLGALTGVVGVWASRVVVRSTRWGGGLRDALREALLGMSRSPSSLALLALSAAVGEELFFRGALLPSLVGSLGVVGASVASSLTFGLLHVPWNRQLVPWTITAAAMGFVFAGLYLVTGEVLAPIAAHAVINHENLHFLLQKEPNGRVRV